MKNIVFVSLISSLLIIFNAYAAGENIVLSANKTLFKPGDVISLEATLSDPLDIEKAVFLVGKVGDSKFGKYIQAPIISSPYKWTVNIPITASGVRRYIASGTINGIKVTSNEIQVVIQPDLTQLQQIFFEPGNQYIMVPGQAKQMEVVGRFSDGNNHFISRKILGATYSENIVNGLSITSGDSPVISVSEDGMVTALQPGIAEVVATNNGISNVRRIKVIEGSNTPVTNAPEDFDSDGDIDKDDLDQMKSRFGTNATGSDDPYDLNKDGVINVLDFRQVVRLCTRALCSTT